MRVRTYRWRAGWLAAWIVVLAAGMSGVANFETRPGDPGRTRSSWPKSTAIERASDRPTLVLFIHPLCPCTRATLNELERLLARCNREIALRIAVSWDGPERPQDELGLVERARSLPGAVVIEDVGAFEARLFGAATSGHALAYSADGTLLFGGGITSARGHEGASRGADALLRSLLEGVRADDGIPVFGCALLGAS